MVSLFVESPDDYYEKCEVRANSWRQDTPHFIPYISALNLIKGQSTLHFYYQNLPHISITKPYRTFLTIKPNRTFLPPNPTAHFYHQTLPHIFTTKTYRTFQPRRPTLYFYHDMTKTHCIFLLLK